MLKGTEQG